MSALEREWRGGTRVDAACDVFGALVGWDVDAVLDEDPDPRRMAALLRVIREAKRTLALADDLVTVYVADRLGRGVHDLGDQGVWEVRLAGRRTEWDHDSLTAEVAARIAEDQGYPVAPIRAVIDAYRQFAGSPTWSVKALEAAGIDWDGCCRTRWVPTAKEVSG